MTVMLLENRMKSVRIRRRHAGFTLIELMVVMVIIGILMSLLVPAVMAAMKKTRVAAMKTEVDGIASAVEAYRDEYGEYPPDFSDQALVLRHFRTIFPQMVVAEFQLLTNMMNQGGAFSEQNINRAEALVFVLGGYSGNPLNPLTGDGGPFEFIGTDPTDYTHYQYRVTRTNPMFEFDPTQLTVQVWNTSATSAPTPTNKTISSEGDGDIFPVYAPPNKIAPYVYFDSRTYGFLPDVGVPNCFPSATAASVVGYVRPMKVATPATPPASGYGSVGAAIRGWEFANPKTFQVHAAGDDDQFGAQTSVVQSGAPLYWFAGTGNVMLADPSASGPNAMLMPIKGFQEVSINTSLPSNFMADNITNFSTSTLSSDL